MKGLEVGNNGTVYSPSTIRSHKMAKNKNDYERKKLDKKSTFDKGKQRTNGKIERERVELLDKLKHLKLQQHMYGTLQRYPDDDEEFKSILTVSGVTKDVKDDKHKRSKSDETSDSFEASGVAYARSRNRRISKEFEDLDIHSATGTLYPPINKTNTKHKHTSLPSLTKKSTSKEFVYEYSGTKERYWVGEPEAIQSVRRNRKTVNQQKMVTLQFRLSRSESDNKLSQDVPDGALDPKSWTGSAQSIFDVTKPLGPPINMPDIVLNNGTSPMENYTQAEFSIKERTHEDTAKPDIYSIEKSPSFSPKPILKKSSSLKPHQPIDSPNHRSSPEESSRFLFRSKAHNPISLSLPGSMPGSPTLSRQNDTNPRKQRSKSFNENNNTFKNKGNMKKVTFCLNSEVKKEPGANVVTRDNDFGVELPDLYKSSSALLSKRLQSR